MHIFTLTLLVVMSDNDLLYKIALTNIPLVGPVLARSLVGFSGGVKAVFEQRKSDLLKIPGIGVVIADCIVNKSTFDKAEGEVDFIARQGITPLFYLDKNYPLRLKRIRDAPVILYYKGTADLNNKRIVGVIGTRKPTAYGINQCEKLVESLKRLNVLVISGLAYGIDITAHRKALQLGVETVAVLGTGLDQIYPAVHKRTASDMLQQGGILSEFGQGTGPDRENFPMRNRILAGMCDAVVVVESGERGGSMITAQLANGYHKDVFAVPGRVGDTYSKGCNHLIKSNKAQMLESGAELSAIMQWHEEERVSDNQRSMFEELTPQEQCVCEILEGASPINIDRLYKETNLTPSEMAAVLLGLEFKGTIKALPGKMYMLV